jgi:hypothetical protein
MGNARDALPKESWNDPGGEQAKAVGFLGNTTRRKHNLSLRRAVFGKVFNC